MASLLRWKRFPECTARSESPPTALRGDRTSCATRRPCTRGAFWEMKSFKSLPPSWLPAPASWLIRGVWRDKNLNVEIDFDAVTDLMRSGPWRISKWKVHYKLSRSPRAPPLPPTAHQGWAGFIPDTSGPTPGRGGARGWG